MLQNGPTTKLITTQARPHPHPQHCSTRTIRSCLRSCWIGSFCNHWVARISPTHHICAHIVTVSTVHNTRLILAQRLVIKSTQVSHIWWYVCVCVYFLSLYGAPPYKMNKTELLMLLLTVLCTSFSTSYLYVIHISSFTVAYTLRRLCSACLVVLCQCVKCAFSSGYSNFRMWMQWKPDDNFLWTRVRRKKFLAV